MTLELWLPFVLTSAIILIIPGPTILLVISQAVSHGRRSVIPLVLGVVAGDFSAMTLSLLGLGALLSTSALLFSIFKWIGAAYLVYLGIRMIVSGGNSSKKAESEEATGFSLFRSSYLVTVFNPKSIAFFVAFFPQFVNPARAILPQSFILGASFLFLAFLNSTLYALFAGRLRELMQTSRVQRWFSRLGGGVLIGAGLFTAAEIH